jgi:hypothetical protein
LRAIQLLHGLIPKVLEFIPDKLLLRNAADVRHGADLL